MALPAIRTKLKTVSSRNKSLQDVLPTLLKATKIISIAEIKGALHNTRLVCEVGKAEDVFPGKPIPVREHFYNRLDLEQTIQGLTYTGSNIIAIITQLNLQGCDFNENDLELVSGVLRAKDISLGYYNKNAAPTTPIGCVGAQNEIFISCSESDSFIDYVELGYRLGDVEDVIYNQLFYSGSAGLGFLKIQDWDSELGGILRILNTVDNPYAKIFIKSYLKLNIHQADGKAYEAVSEEIQNVYNGSTYDNYYIYEVCMTGRPLACPLNYVSVGGTCTGLYDSRSAIRISLQYDGNPPPDFISNAVLWVELNNEIVKIEIKSGMYSDGENRGYFINSDGSLTPLIGTVTGEFILRVGAGTDYCGSTYPTVGIYTVDDIWYSLDNPMSYSTQDLVTASKVRALCPEEIGSDMREGYDVCVNDFTPNHYIYTCSKVTTLPNT